MLSCTLLFLRHFMRNFKYVSKDIHTLNCAFEFSVAIKFWKAKISREVVCCEGNYTKDIAT